MWCKSLQKSSLLHAKKRHTHPKVCFKSYLLINYTKTKIMFSLSPMCNSRFYLCIDINECSDNSDNCDVDAHCNNTVGSYNCTCNPGYIGNGTTCTGKYVFFFSGFRLGIMYNNLCMKNLRKLLDYHYTFLWIMTFRMQKVVKLNPQPLEK